jgi:hypothetical protein
MEEEGRRNDRTLKKQPNANYLQESGVHRREPAT